jgi:hypothetical protein
MMSKAFPNKRRGAFMNIPSNYRAIFRVYLRFAIVMIFVALLSGIMFQESSKKTPFSEVLPPGLHLEAIINLALIHGHAFLVGVLIPLAITWMLYLGLALGYQPIAEKPLKIGSWLYLPASVAVVMLMLYKGYHFQLGVRQGNLDFQALNESLFMGIHPLRAAVYGLSHTAMAAGLGTIVVSFWRSMKQS